MIFQYTHQQVMDGSKTLTSRIVKPNDNALCIPDNSLMALVEGTAGTIKTVYSENGNRLRWQVGRCYAIQPARTAKATGRFELLAIKRYDVRDITADEARREGFDNELAFWQVWCSMHDKRAFDYVAIPIRHEVERAREYLKRRLDHGMPIDDKFQAWQLAFKLVESYGG